MTSDAIYCQNPFWLSSSSEADITTKKIKSTTNHEVERTFSLADEPTLSNNAVKIQTFILNLYLFGILVLPLFMRIIFNKI